MAERQRWTLFVVLALHIAGVLLNLCAIAAILWARAEIVKLDTRVAILEMKTDTMENLSQLVTRAEQVLGEDLP